MAHIVLRPDLDVLGSQFLSPSRCQPTRFAMGRSAHCDGTL